MSKSSEDKIPEIQSSFVQTFLKSKLGKDALISSNFRKEYSKCLSLFLFYLSTIAKHNQGDSKKKLTKNCILKALSDIGFEDFADQLSDFKQTLPLPTNKQQTNKEEKELNDQIQPSQEQQGDNGNGNEENQDDVQSDVSQQEMEEINENAFQQEDNNNNQQQEEQQQQQGNILDQLIRNQPYQEQNNQVQEYQEMF